jgi:hypothetical protein
VLPAARLLKAFRRRREVFLAHRVAVAARASPRPLACFPPVAAVFLARVFRRLLVCFPRHPVVVLVVVFRRLPGCFPRLRAVVLAAAFRFLLPVRQAFQYPRVS